jgi:hypothetical protein
MAAYLVARGEHLSFRGIEVNTHETQACSVGLLKPIHDGRGLRSRHSVVGVEEEQRRAIDRAVDDGDAPPPQATSAIRMQLIEASS